MTPAISKRTAPAKRTLARTFPTPENPFKHNVNTPKSNDIAADPAITPVGSN